MFFNRLIFLMFVFAASSQVQAQTASPTAMDFDVSGTVDFPDFLVFVKAFSEDGVQADVDGNGVVEFADFLAFAGAFGQDSGLRQVAYTNSSQWEALLKSLGQSEGPILFKDVENLRHIKIGGGVWDLRFLKTLPQVDTVTINGSNFVLDLSQLAELPNLTHLNIHLVKHTDFEPLSNLTQLKSLRISHLRTGPLTNISFLNELTELERLELQTLGLIDARRIRNFKKLKHLKLDNTCCRWYPRETSNQVSYIDWMSDLTALESLDMTDNQVNDISVLSDLTSLRTLKLAQNQVRDLSPISQASNLDTLYIGGNPLRDLSPLANLTQLRVLRISPRSHTKDPETGVVTAVAGQQNEIVDLSALHDLVNLTRLSLYIPQVRDISVLGNLSSLNTLSFLGLSQVDLGAVTRLTNLTTLSIAGDETIDISPVLDLVGLRTLSLTGMPIGDFSEISSLVSLEDIWFTHNQMKDLMGISSLANLHTLRITQNEVRDVSRLSALPVLRFATLMDNKIEDLTSVLDVFEDGDVLRLDGNPLSDDAMNVQIPAFEARGVRVTF